MMRWKLICGAIAGGIYGVVNQTAHYWGKFGEPFAELLGRGWAWALCGTLAGLFTEKFLDRMLLIMATLAASTFAYYATAVWWVIRTVDNLIPRPWWEMLLDRSSVITGWLAIAVFFCPAMALLAKWFQVPGWRRPAALLITASMIFWDANSKREFISPTQQLARATNFGICAVALGAGALGLAGLVCHLWRANLVARKQKAL